MLQAYRKEHNMKLLKRPFDNIKSVKRNDLLISILSVVTLAIIFFSFFPQLFIPTVDFVSYFFSINLWIGDPLLKGLIVGKILAWAMIILYVLFFLFQNPQRKYKDSK